MKKFKSTTGVLVIFSSMFFSQLVNAEMNDPTTGATPDPTPIIDQPNLDFDSKTSRSSASMLPSSFDPRLTEATHIKNQGSRGICWAFSSIGTIESALSKKRQKTTDFSELYVDYSFAKNAFGDLQNNMRSYNRLLGTGGQEFYTLYAAINWEQPISEARLPYVPYGSIPFMTDQQLREPAVTHVQGMVAIPALAKTYTASEKQQKINIIKKQVLNKSGVTYQWRSTYLNRTDRYNPKTNAFYTPQQAANEPITHSTLIVGWDDSYSKDNFGSKPSQNGAFIVKNSWNTSWGDNGYYYLSYDDYYLATSQVYGVSQVDATTNYVNNYHHAQFYNYNARPVYYETATIATVFKKKTAQEALKAISFHTAQYNTPYDIYVLPNATDFSSHSWTTSDLIKVGSGVKELPGIDTVSLSTPVKLPSGTSTFAVIVTLKKPETTSNLYLLTEQPAASGRYANVVVKENASFISMSDDRNPTTFDFSDLSNQSGYYTPYSGNAYTHAFTNPY